MKKQILISLLLLFTTMIYGQTKYDIGFKTGYKEGYCYNDIGCIAPIPPITPIPLIGENSDSYKDGYNRGFKRGLEDKQVKKTSSGNSQGSCGGRTSQSAQAQFQSTVAPIDYNLLMNIISMKQAANEKNEQQRREKSIGLMDQVKSYYNSLNSYPDLVKNGWHKVIAMDNYDFCEERKVYVENNKVTKYVVDNWLNRKVSYPVLINNAKAMIQLVQDNGTTAIVDLYFLEDINNPNSYTSPPLQSGKISFWTNLKSSGSMELYFDGMYAGTFTSYFKDGTPNCGQDGTITIECKPGTYKYYATGQGFWGSKSWEGSVTIKEGGCSLQGLVK